MGIEPTRDPSEPHTGFEDQGHHQIPVTSAGSNQNVIALGWLLAMDTMTRLHFTQLGHNDGPLPL